MTLAHYVRTVQSDSASSARCSSSRMCWGGGAAWGSGTPCAACSAAPRSPAASCAALWLLGNAVVHTTAGGVHMQGCAWLVSRPWSPSRTPPFFSTTPAHLDCCHSQQRLLSLEQGPKGWIQCCIQRASSGSGLEQLFNERQAAEAPQDILGGFSY